MPLERRTGLMESSSVSTPSLVPQNPVPGCEPDTVFFPVIICGQQYTAESIDLVRQTAQVRPANVQERHMYAEALRTAMLPSGPEQFVPTVNRAVGMYLRGGGDTLQVLRIAHYSDPIFGLPDDSQTQQPAPSVQPQLPQYQHPQPVVPDPLDSALSFLNQWDIPFEEGRSPSPPPPPRGASLLASQRQRRTSMASLLDDAIYDACRTGVFIVPERATAQDITGAMARLQAGELNTFAVSSMTITLILQQMEQCLGATAAPLPLIPQPPVPAPGQPLNGDQEAALFEAFQDILDGAAFIPPSGITPRMIQVFVEELMGGDVAIEPPVPRRDLREACKQMIDVAMALATGQFRPVPSPHPTRPQQPLPPRPSSPAPQPSWPPMNAEDEGMAFPHHPQPGEPPAGLDLPAVPMIPAAPIPIPGGDINQQLTAAIVSYAMGGALQLPPDISPKELLGFLRSMQRDPALQQQLIEQGLSAQQIHDIFSTMEAVAGQLLESLGIGPSGAGSPPEPDPLPGPSTSAPQDTSPRPSRSNSVSSSSSSSSSSDSEAEIRDDVYATIRPVRPPSADQSQLAVFRHRASIAQGLHEGNGEYFECPLGVTSADLRRFQEELIRVRTVTPLGLFFDEALPQWTVQKDQYLELLGLAITQLEETEQQQAGGLFDPNGDNDPPPNLPPRNDLEQGAPSGSGDQDLAASDSEADIPLSPVQQPLPSQPQLPVPPGVAIAQALLRGRGRFFQIPEGVSPEQLRQFAEELIKAGDDETTQVFMNQWLPHWPSFQNVYIELLEQAAADFDQAQPGRADNVAIESVDPHDAEGGRSPAGSRPSSPAPGVSSSPQPASPSSLPSGYPPTVGAVIGGAKGKHKSGRERLKDAVNRVLLHKAGDQFQVPKGTTRAEAEYRFDRLKTHPPKGMRKLDIREVLSTLRDYIESQPKPKAPKILGIFTKKTKPAPDTGRAHLDQAIENYFLTSEENEPFHVPSGTPILDAAQCLQDLRATPPRYALSDDLEVVREALRTFIERSSGCGSAQNSPLPSGSHSSGRLTVSDISGPIISEPLAGGSASTSSPQTPSAPVPRPAAPAPTAEPKAKTGWFMRHLLGKRGDKSSSSRTALMAAVDQALSGQPLEIPRGTKPEDIRAALKQLKQTGHRASSCLTLEEFRTVIHALEARLPENNTPRARLKKAVYLYVLAGEALSIPEGVSAKEVQYRIRRLHAPGGMTIEGMSRERLRQVANDLERLLQQQQQGDRHDPPPAHIPPKPSRSTRGSTSGSIGGGSVSQLAGRQGSRPSSPVDAQGSPQASPQVSRTSSRASTPQASAGGHTSPRRPPPPVPSQGNHRPLDSDQSGSESDDSGTNHGRRSNPFRTQLTRALSELDLAVTSDDEGGSDVDSARPARSPHWSSDTKL